MMARPRGRPRTFDEDDVKQSILNTFWKNGFGATSLDDLSKATGLVRPSLSGAFGSKRDMYVMSMDVYLAKLATARDALNTAKSAEDALIGFNMALLDVFIGDDSNTALGCFLVGTALSEAPVDAELRLELSRRLERFQDVLSAALMAKAPKADASALKAATNLAVATLHSLAVRARAGAAKDELLGFANQSAKAVAGILA